jgi:hypothetical protein
MRRREWAVRLVVALVVALVVVLAVVAPTLLSPDGGATDDPVATPEFSAEQIGVAAIPAEGEVRPDVDGEEKVVVFDDDHNNRFDRGDVGALVRGITRAGGTIRYHRSGELNESLADADAFVIVDPARSYSPEEVAALRAFTDAGGRVFLAAEPDRIRVSASLFGASITTIQSDVTTLGTEYGINFDTEYLYNTETNDGNYRNVVVEPADGETFAGVERVTMYTAAELHTRSGETALVTAEGTRESGTDRTGQFAVAVVQGNLLAMSDVTFMRSDRYNVADNEVVVERIVEFLLSGERIPTVEEPDPETDNETAADGGGGEEPTGNETADDGSTGNETALVPVSRPTG